MLDSLREPASSWRNELATRVAGSFSLVYLAAIPVLLFTLQGPGVRMAMAGISLTCAAAAAIPLLFGRPTGELRAWLLVGPAVLAALAGFAMLGFLAGPALVLALTLVTGGLLLGRRGLFVLCAIALVGLVSIAWGVSSGALPVPAPYDVAFTNARTWTRTIAITFLASLVLGILVVDIVSRLERSLDKVRSEVALREQAERARADAEIAAHEAKQLETLGRLAAGVAHDFNNSLTAILGCAELLRDSVPKGAHGQELIAAIISSSERAGALTKQLLAYSRKAQMVLKPVDVNQLVEGALTLLRGSLSTGITVERKLSASHSVIQADAALLQNAVINLLVNARDAMPDGGHLTVSTADREVRGPDDAFGQALVPGNYLLLEVRDTGTGIDKAALPKIFEPFFTTKAVGQGTGLGLAAVAGTVRSHGGAIDVQTEVGHGTGFRVLLPLGAPEAPSQADDLASQIVHGTGHILLVDDDTVVRSTGEACMRAFGYEVTAVGDGERALVLVGQGSSFDLVVLDLRMPKLSGPETFARLRQLAPKLPVLVWSGYAAEHDVERMLAEGAVGFVQKPYAMGELSRALARAIAKPDPRSAGEPGRKAATLPAGDLETKHS